MVDTVTLQAAYRAIFTRYPEAPDPVRLANRATARDVLVCCAPRVIALEWLGSCVAGRCDGCGLVYFSV